jgi:hypothetical protein
LAAGAGGIADWRRMATIELVYSLGIVAIYEISRRNINV